jgi:hypothetical protein
MRRCGSGNCGIGTGLEKITGNSPEYHKKFSNHGIFAKITLLLREFR